MTRSTQIRAFLDAHHGVGGKITPLAGDASGRQYHRVTTRTDTVLVMDLPATDTATLSSFAKMTAHLSHIGLSPPRIFATDQDQSLMLLEDLGDAVFARLLQANPAAESQIYLAATDVLAHIASSAPATGLPTFHGMALAENTALVLDYYAHGDREALINLIQDALAPFDAQRKIMVLRDFHAENLIWLPDRHGLRKVGLLDYQDAGLGYAGFDLVSLIQDARRDVAATTHDHAIQRYADKTGLAMDLLTDQLAVLGAQRALRIMGIFARLCLVHAKPRYLTLLPRVWQHLQTNLACPPNAGLAKWVARTLPEPTPPFLSELANRCGSLAQTR